MTINNNKILTDLVNSLQIAKMVGHYHQVWEKEYINDYFEISEDGLIIHYRWTLEKRPEDCNYMFSWNGDEYDFDPYEYGEISLELYLKIKTILLSKTTYKGQWPK